MVFTQSVPAQAASWRETLSSNAGIELTTLYYGTPPIQFGNSVSYTRLRRVYGYGNDAVRKPIRGQSYSRQYTVGNGQFADTDRCLQLPTSTEQVMKCLMLLDKDKVAVSNKLLSETVSVNPDYIIIQNRDVAQNKLEMEEFSDLTSLLSGAISNVVPTGSTDELNTPVFDKEAFNFSPPITPVKADENKNKLKVKVEYNTQYYSYGKHNIYTALENQEPTKEIYRISDVGNEQNDMYLYQPFAHSLSNKEKPNEVPSPSNQEENFLGKLSFDEASFSNNLSLNHNYVKNSNSTATSPQNDDGYSCISSPCDDQRFDLSMPEHYDHSYDKKPKLNLMTEQFKFPIKQEGLSTLNTPDVIDEVVKMGNDFNILDLVNNEDITIVSADDELLSSLTSPSAFSSEPSTPPKTINESISNRRTKRRKLSVKDDDDEDYVPPLHKKRSTVRLADIDIENSSSSDDSYYASEKSTRKLGGKQRGRPPKRGDSVSSDGSKDQDVSRYRELRDKNNEASRKSRLKRKIKEQEYEKEADDLHIRNIRLKAQVEELEKLVSTFRNNLFKILVTK